MIEKLDPIKHTDNLYDRNGFITNLACGGVVISKVNEIVDAVNKLETMAKNTNTVLESLVQENNIHEKQIDELQMKDEELAERINYTLAKATGDKEALKLLDEKCKPVDKFAEQRKWIGKLCRFWDFVYDHYYFDTLKGITDKGLFIGHNGSWEHCEPVKPDDDIIYKGGDND